MASFACAFVTSIALIMVILIMPESPTWLHRKAKLKELEQTPTEKKTALELFRDKGLRRRVLVLWFMWFTSSMCSYAIDLNSSEISGNLFVNQILFSVIVITAKWFLIPFDALQFSRRNLHQYSQLMAIIFSWH
uniref:Major facilitator superfamily (MFS) profile domain-containing protein n=1 Tax=Ditylenchus dipsaci TaxID=166011 RepID=A0A915DX03_9BILA